MTEQNQMMQVVRIHEYGSPEVMQLEEQSIPTPGPKEVLVRVKVASVNFIDIQQRRGDLVKQRFYSEKAGLDPNLPVTVGSQGVGVVEVLGDDVDHVKVGDRVVCAGGGGTYASHVLMPAQRLIPIPDDISFETAAAGMVQGFLAWAFTHRAYPVKPGDWCMVQAAAGGVGLLLCQMAKFRGGRVIGVTSKEEKAQYVREAGVDEVIISTQMDMADEVKRITEGKGVNVVYDGVGKDTFEANLDSLTLGGYFIIYGQASGYVPPFDLMKLQEKGSLFLTRTNGLPYMKEWPQYIQDFVKWTKSGQLFTRIDHKYSLADAALAHEAMEQRKTSGRVLLYP